MNWVDIVVIAIVVLTAGIGLWRGLFESILSLVGTFLSVFLAVLASKPVASFLNKIAKMDQLFMKLLKSDEGVTLFGKTFTNEKIAALCTIVLAIVIVWILIKLAIFLLSRLFDSAVSKSNALSGLNRVLGLFFGAVKGAAIVLVVLGLLFCASLLPFVGDKLEKPIMKSGFTQKIYVYVGEWVGDKLGDRIYNVVDSLVDNDEEKEEETPTNESEEEENVGSPVLIQEYNGELVATIIT